MTGSRLAAAAAVALASALAPGAGASPARSGAACGLPDAAPVWIDYGEASVQQDVRDELARPGVVVATSGTGVPTLFRQHGAATMEFVLNLPRIVGQPSAPTDPASIVPAADALYAKAAAETACATPWIALNELAGSALPTPWSATNATYRANILALLQELASHGARPALLIHDNPNVAGDAAAWWSSAAQSADLVYEAYYDAPTIYGLGSLIGNRRMRLGMRSIIARFEGIGVPAARIGIMLGFHSARTPGIAGRQGLAPREAWLRVVKWEALAARQVAQETKIASVWSWGWGTFGPDSVDPDKAAAACVYLWTRDSKLCDGPAAGGPGFDTSLVEGQIVVRPGAFCTFAGGTVPAVSVRGLARLTRDLHLAATAAFGRAVLQKSVPVAPSAVAAVERAAVRRLGGIRAYRRALARRGASLAVARGVIADELRRRAIAATRAKPGSGTTTLEWAADRTAPAADTAICLGDQLPGSGDFPRSNALEVGVVQLPALLPFLFADRMRPAVPQALAAQPGTGGVTLSWQPGAESDLAGYDVYRTGDPAGPQKLNRVLLTRPAFVDSAPVAGASYVVRALDTSGNASAPSAPATPAS